MSTHTTQWYERKAASRRLRSAVSALVLRRYCAPFAVCCPACQSPVASSRTMLARASRLAVVTVYAPSFILVRECSVASALPASGQRKEEGSAACSIPRAGPQTKRRLLRDHHPPDIVGFCGLIMICQPL